MGMTMPLDRMLAAIRRRDPRWWPSRMCVVQEFPTSRTWGGYRETRAGSGRAACLWDIYQAAGYRSRGCACAWGVDFA